MSVTYIVSNSRTESSWKTEIGTEVTHVTRATLSRLKCMYVQHDLVGKKSFTTMRNTPVITRFTVFVIVPRS